jgi:ferredoxin
MSRVKMSKEREQSLRQLAKLMNTRHRLKFPITRPLLECFDVAVTPEAAHFLLRMGLEQHTYEEAASMSDLGEDAFRAFFDAQVRKGLLWPAVGVDGKERYYVPGIMVGWFEVFLSDGQETAEKQEFSKRLDRLFKSWGKMNFFPLRNLMNRRLRRYTTPSQSIAPVTNPEASGQPRKLNVDRKVQVPQAEIHHASRVYDLIEKHGEANAIAVVHCFCRQWRKMVEEPCRFDFPAEACIVIGEGTKYAVKGGIGRYVSKEEALALVKQLEKKGAVHQIFHEQENVDRPEIGICNCCWDCCGVFGSYNRGIIPLKFKSYVEAQIANESLCCGCGTCAKHCPVEAIAVDDGTSHVNVSKCIGCGQCELQCPEGVIRMIPRERVMMLPLQKRSEARISW